MVEDSWLYITLSVGWLPLVADEAKLYVFVRIFHAINVSWPFFVFGSNMLCMLIARWESWVASYLFDERMAMKTNGKMQRNAEGRLLAFLGLTSLLS